MRIRFASQLLRAGLVLIFGSGLVLGNFSPVLAALQCYVKADAIGANDGSSWLNAYTSLQSALGGSLCTEVWVGIGTYKPTGDTDRTISFALKSGVAIYGGFVGTEMLRDERDPVANPTVLSGDLGILGDVADNSYHVVTGSGTDSTAILDGFTITGGKANGIGPNNAGGGIYNTAGSPTLMNLVFSGNSASMGGGMYNTAGSNPSLTGVVFSNNSTTGRGGGMYNDGSSPDLVSVVFSANSARGTGGGMYNTNSRPALQQVTFKDNWAKHGGGMDNYMSSPDLLDVTFRGNSATEPNGGGNGGGMQNTFGSNPNLQNVTFRENSAHHNGGGINNYISSSPRLTNVTFSGNSAGGTGGGINNYSSSNPILINVTFSQNGAAVHGGAICNDGSSPTVTNSILYGDIGGEIADESGSPIVTYSIVQGGYPGTGNLAQNPLLAPLKNNGGLTETYALKVGSRAIDSGTDSYCPSTDQRGAARPEDGNGDGIAGCDMGATESRQLFIATFQSRGVEDGWVAESSEISSQGGVMNSDRITLVVGDDAANRQVRSILSFDTSNLPDDAIIAYAALRVRRASVVGINPFTTHGALLADIRRGSFGNLPSLQLVDFQARPSQSAAGKLKPTARLGWHTAPISRTAYRFINLGGYTQFRLRFALDDDNDFVADYVTFYSGNYVTNTEYWPKLIIKYYLP